MLGHLHPLFKTALTNDNSVGIDLSQSSTLLNKLKSSVSLDTIIKEFLLKNKKPFAYGGYLEKRNLYEKYNHINGEARNIHLGIDVWSLEQEAIFCPLDGEVVTSIIHKIPGDYGGLIILKHLKNNNVFHSLYGHLSHQSITNLSVGTKLHQGEKFASLGIFEENGNWPIHLHFQLIMQDSIAEDNFPGVCAVDTLEAFKHISPDPISWIIQP